MSSDPDQTSDATKAADEEEAKSAHDADRAPTPEEEAAAERQPLDPSVGEHFKEMDEIGADVKGEGQIEP